MKPNELPPRSRLARWLRGAVFTVIALVIGAVIIVPLLPSLIDWWAGLPHNRTTHHFKDSSITFTTWYVTIDPLDTGRSDFWFEVRDGSRVIKDGIFYSTYCGSPALISTVQGLRGEPFGVYLIHRRQAHSPRDCAAVVLYDPATKTIAGRNNTGRDYPSLEPTGDVTNWGERFRTATQLHAMLLLSY